MKNIFFACIAFITIPTNAQTIEPLENYTRSPHQYTDNMYFKDVNHIFDKFLGTWEYRDSTDYLKIIITKSPKRELGLTTFGRRIRKVKTFFDEIDVAYLYKHNGIVVYDRLPHLIIDGEIPLASSISGSHIKNVNQIELFYDEPSTTTCERNRYGWLVLYYQPSSIPSGMPQLQWERTTKKNNPSEVYCQGGIIDESEYQIPASLIVTKVE